MTTVSYIISDKSLTMILDDDRINIAKGSHGFEQASHHLQYSTDHNVDFLRKLSQPKSAVEHLSDGKMSLNDGGYQINNVTVPKELKNHIHNLRRKNYDVTIIERFLDKVMQIPNTYQDANGLTRQNPWAEQTRQSIFGFLSSNGYVITDDGDFLAEKIVSSDYGSLRRDSSGNRVYYHVGTNPELPRYACDHNPDKTCSSGLHVCSDGYHFGSFSPRSDLSDKLLICKINPKDVVSIPDEYGMNKIRVCKMHVLKESEIRGSLRDMYFENKDDTPVYEYPDYEDDDHTELYDYGDFLEDFADDNEQELAHYAKKLKNRQGSKQDIIRSLKSLPCDDEYAHPFCKLTPAMSRSEILHEIENLLPTY